MRRITLLFAFLIFPFVDNGQSILSFNGQPDWKAGIDIASHTFSYEEISNRPMTLEEVMGKPFLPFHENENRYSKKPRIVIWLKFIIHNTHPNDTLHFILNVNAHRYIQLYQQGKLIVERGTIIRNRNVDRFGVPLFILPSERSVYWVRVEERVRQLTPLHVHLETPYTYYHHLARQNQQERWLRFLMPLMSGFLLLVSIFGLFQYYLLKDSAFLYYFLYAFFAFLLSFFCMEDRFNLMVFTNSTKNINDAVLWNAVPAGYILFISKIINIPKYYPKIWLASKIILVILIVQSILTCSEYLTGRFLFESNLYYGFLTGLTGLGSTALMLAACIMSKSLVKHFLIFGISSLLILFFIPLCIGFTHFSGELNYEIASIIDYGPFIFIMGVCVEAICFAFALAYRNKLVITERDRLQSNYALELQFELDQRTAQLQSQNKLLEEQKIKQLETEFAHKIAETEMAALRAQMNPHFIFNCLNSIKLYTLENDSTAASEYLTMFSNLIRIVLENSRTEKVTLKKELETLRLYIELEAMRFKNKVTYAINCEEDIDQEYIEIPPLILQPYVENAIWHGLMHKAEGGLITITITQPKEDELQIEISDNGIGRELAREFKSKSAMKHKSFGHRMTAERINTINQVYQTNTSVEILDLKDVSNNPSGTRVRIRIPL